MNLPPTVTADALLSWAASAAPAAAPRVCQLDAGKTKPDGTVLPARASLECRVEPACAHPFSLAQATEALHEALRRAAFVYGGVAWPVAPSWPLHARLPRAEGARDPREGTIQADPVWREFQERLAAGAAAPPPAPPPVGAFGEPGEGVPPPPPRPMAALVAHMLQVAAAAAKKRGKAAAGKAAGGKAAGGKAAGGKAATSGKAAGGKATSKAGKGGGGGGAGGARGAADAAGGAAAGGGKARAGKKKKGEGAGGGGESGGGGGGPAAAAGAGGVRRGGEGAGGGGGAASGGRSRGGGAEQPRGKSGGGGGGGNNRAGGGNNIAVAQSGTARKKGRGHGVADGSSNAALSATFDTPAGPGVPAAAPPKRAAATGAWAGGSPR